MNRRIESKFGLIEINENISGLGWDLFLEGQFMKVYIGDPDNDAEIINSVSSMIDTFKSDKEKRKEDGVTQMVINKDEIISNIDEWVKYHLPKSFTFRKHQKETIIAILDNILNDENKNPCHMVEAPTGSGKSLINIICAGVLDYFYGMTSYILCSDLYLWEQYAQFLKENPKIKFGCLKGQTGNYTCMLNGEDMRNADCKMANVSWRSLINGNAEKLYGYDCCRTCEYVQARKKALKSNVTMMTYQLYLYAINILFEQIKQGGGDTGGALQPRDIIFCDECHNIPGIVQANFTPQIKKEDNYYFMNLYDWGLKNNYIPTPGITSVYDMFENRDAFEKELLQLYWDFIDDKVQKQLLYETINRYYNIMISLNDIAQCGSDYVKSKKTHRDDKVDKEDFKIFKISNWMSNHMCFWNDFFTAITSTGKEYICKDIIEPGYKQNEQNPEKYTELHCTKEDFLCWKFLYEKAKYRVCITATMGGKEAFEENNGFHYSEEGTGRFEVIPSIFDFSKSPIYLLTRYKMTLKERKKNIEHINKIISQIVTNKFKNNKGIIQTGSYEIAKSIYYAMPPEIKSRMLIYKGSREKTVCVKIHKKSKNTILIGPTLNQGMDLPDDHCRFIIICKVPYPSLGSELVKEKCRLFRKWYESTTSNEIIQGIGRGVRNEYDHCTTYILDASFMELYKNTIDQYPEELQDRIEIIN